MVLKKIPSIGDIRSWINTGEFSVFDTSATELESYSGTISHSSSDSSNSDTDSYTFSEQSVTETDTLREGGPPNYRIDIYQTYDYLVQDELVEIDINGTVIFNGYWKNTSGLRGTGYTENFTAPYTVTIKSIETNDGDNIKFDMRYKADTLTRVDRQVKSTTL